MLLTQAMREKVDVSMWSRVSHQKDEKHTLLKEFKAIAEVALVAYE